PLRPSKFCRVKHWAARTNHLRPNLPEQVPSPETTQPKLTTYAPTLKKPNPAPLAWTKRPKTSASPIRTNRRRKISLRNTIPRNTAHLRTLLPAVTAAMIAAVTAAGAESVLNSGAGAAVSAAVDAGVVVAISARAAAVIFLPPSTPRRKVANAVLIAA